jgi:hypothetical protein
MLQKADLSADDKKYIASLDPELTDARGADITDPAK